MPFLLLTFLAVGAAAVAGAAYWAARSIRAEGSLSRLEPTFESHIRQRVLKKQLIPAKVFGDIEKNISDLKEVIVVAHRIEEPQESLRAAVQDNFQEGVRYTFLVSQSEHSSASKTYTEFFKAIFVIAKQLAPESGDHSKIRTLEFNDLFAVRALRGEWGSWSYVFYRYNGISGTPLKMVAFRGDQLREGIAENYVELSAADALSIFNACGMALADDATHEVAAEEFQFEDASNLPTNVEILDLRRAR